MAEPTFEWSSDILPDRHVVFIGQRSGSVAIGVQRGADTAAIILSREAVASLREWLNELTRVRQCGAYILVGETGMVSDGVSGESWAASFPSGEGAGPMSRAERVSLISGLTTDEIDELGGVE